MADATTTAVVAPEIQLHEFTVTTTELSAEDGTLDVIGASIPDDQLDLLLRTPPYVLYARNQDGVPIELSFDMDFETLDARVVELTPDGPRYLDAAAADSNIAPPAAVVSVDRRFC